MWARWALLLVWSIPVYWFGGGIEPSHFLGDSDWGFRADGRRSNGVEIRFSEPIVVENVRESKTDPYSHKDVSHRDSNEVPAPIIPKHFQGPQNDDHLRSDFIGGGNIEAHSTKPIRIEHAGLFLSAGGILNSNVPKEVSSWRLAGIASNKIDEGKLLLSTVPDACRFYADIGPDLRLANPPRFIDGTFGGLKGEPQEYGLNSDSNKLQESYDNRSYRQSNGVSVEFVLGRSVCGLVLGLVLSIFGWKNIYDQRRLIGAALVCCGWLLGALSLLSILLAPL